MNEIYLPADSLPLILEADYGKAVKPYAHCDRTAEFNVLIYVLCGEMEIYEDEAVYTLTENTLFFLKSGVHHWGVKPFSAGTSWYYVHFLTRESAYPSAPMPEFHGKCYLNGEDYKRSLMLPKLSRPEGQDFLRSIKTLCEQFNSGEYIKASLALAEELLSLSEHTGGSSPRDRVAAEAQRFISGKYASGFTAAELEEALGFSYKYIGTKLKAATGLSIREYQRELRFREAQRLLAQTNMQVSEIAAQLGFYDVFSFSKLFRREKGISPTKYRQSYIPNI